MPDKLKLALYWAATCGGCEVAVLDLNEKILQLAEAADIYLWPVAMDYKYRDAESWADQFIDVCLFNGAIRNSEGERMAHLLRRKSKVFVAFGSCACFGGIPGLANQADAEEVLDRVYRQTPSTVNPDGVRPQQVTARPEGELTLPTFYNTVRALGHVEDVDYFVPGCPPVPERIWEVIGSLVGAASGAQPWPPKGATLGARETTLCDECERLKEEKLVDRFTRPHLAQTDPQRCLLEQGVICLGPATRGGCGRRCISAWMPCRGCYGPAPGVADQGAKMLSALASILKAENPLEAERSLETVVDPLGTFYRFTLPTSLLERRRMGDKPLTPAKTAPPRH
jgi:F420-non-reducing hydrogenase small subunit